jgi:protocatechuate 3,4-dioxygenase beta subunit
MTRRHVLLALGFTGLSLRFWPSRLLAETQADPDWVRMWDAAQKQRPANLSSVARIASPAEPGQPLVIHGRVFAKDGQRLLPGAVVFAYHTGQDGQYQRAGQTGWRLQGWARTNADGTFEFRTIRPAPYPGRNIPAHVHLTVDGPGIPREWVDELEFADDPLITAGHRQKSDQAGRFGGVRPVRLVDGVQHCDINLRLTGVQRF